VFARAHTALLKIYQRLPRQLRRWVVRLITPSFTVGAACIIERDDGAMLLVRQVYRRGWGMPGGLAQRRELVADTARREVFEEVGLAVELVGEPAVVVDPVPRRVDVIFLARPADGADAAGAAPSSPEIAEVRWFPPDELPDLQHETVAAIAALRRASGGEPAV
jgi:ADP-ribose pyrophosphatase YjhB (NUDIX family)